MRIKSLSLVGAVVFSAATIPAAFSAEPPSAAKPIKRSIVQERPIISPPLQRQLGSLILPTVKFRDADLVGALRYLSQKAAQHSGQKVRVSFSLDLPEDFVPRHELTLDLKNIPAIEALRYLGDQAGVEFQFAGDTVLVRARGTASARVAARQKKESPTSSTPNGNPSSKPAESTYVNPASPLSKSAESTSAGNNVHRSTRGTIQADKSGYVPRRTLSGWSTKRNDPSHTLGVNCHGSARCKAGCGGGCGCHICACWQ